MKLSLSILVVFLIILICPATVFAGTGTGAVSSLLVHQSAGGGGVFMFRTQINTNKAACSTFDSGRQRAVSLADEQGRAMFSLIMMAKSQGLDVNVVGANDCGAWGDRERPLYVHIP